MALSVITSLYGLGPVLGVEGGGTTGGVVEVAGFAGVGLLSWPNAETSEILIIVSKKNCFLKHLERTMILKILRGEDMENKQSRGADLIPLIKN